VQNCNATNGKLMINGEEAITINKTFGITDCAHKFKKAIDFGNFCLLEVS